MQLFHFITLSGVEKGLTITNNKFDSFNEVNGYATSRELMNRRDFFATSASRTETT